MFKIYLIALICAFASISAFAEDEAQISTAPKNAPTAEDRFNYLSNSVSSDEHKDDVLLNFLAQMNLLDHLHGVFFEEFLPTHYSRILRSNDKSVIDIEIEKKFPYCSLNVRLRHFIHDQECTSEQGQRWTGTCSPDGYSNKVGAASRLLRIKIIRDITGRYDVRLSDEEREEYSEFLDPIYETLHSEYLEFVKANKATLDALQETVQNNFVAKEKVLNCKTVLGKEYCRNLVKTTPIQTVSDLVSYSRRLSSNATAVAISE